MSLTLPFFSLAVPFVWSVLPSAFFSLSPVTAPAASFTRPFALSRAPSPLSWLLFLPTCFLPSGVLGVRCVSDKRLSTRKRRVENSQATLEPLGRTPAYCNALKTLFLGSTYLLASLIIAS